tara:strand:- start:8 stop:382 length:375 start_codon:yes stop_codon:yes gene_type:complete
MRSNDMLYLVDHHNSVTTAVHLSDEVNFDDIGNLIIGLRFFDNVYINYQSDEDLFKSDDTPSWCNQDVIIYFEYLEDGVVKYIQYNYGANDFNRWTPCDKPDLRPQMSIGKWGWHDIPLASYGQ